MKDYEERSFWEQMKYVRTKARYFGPSRYRAGNQEARLAAFVMNVWASVCWKYYQAKFAIFKRR